MKTDRRGFIGALITLPFVGRLLPVPTPKRPLLSISKLDEAVRVVMTTRACQITNIGSEIIRVKSIDFGKRRVVVERGA